MTVLINKISECIMLFFKTLIAKIYEGIFGRSWEKINWIYLNIFNHVFNLLFLEICLNMPHGFPDESLRTKILCRNLF